MDTLKLDFEDQGEVVINIEVDGKVAKVVKFRRKIPQEFIDNMYQKYKDPSLYSRDKYAGIPIKRLVQFYGDKGVIYTYDNQPHEHKPWDPSLLTLRSFLDPTNQEGWNSVQIILYQKGEDDLARHADNEVDVDQTSKITSVSAGTTRTMTFYMNDQLIQQVKLENGTVLEMSRDTQEILKHGILKDFDVKEPRVSWIFRKIKTETKKIPADSDSGSKTNVSDMNNRINSVSSNSNTLEKQLSELKQAFDQYKKKTEVELINLRKEVANLKYHWRKKSQTSQSQSTQPQKAQLPQSTQSQPPQPPQPPLPPLPPPRPQLPHNQIHHQPQPQPPQPPLLSIPFIITKLQEFMESTKFRPLSCIFPSCDTLWYIILSSWSSFVQITDT